MVASAPQTPARPSAAPAGRTPMREAQRAPQRQDLSFLDEEDSGPFSVDPSSVPDGMSYKWLRVSTVGKADPRSEARGQRNRWTPVPKKRHPEIVGRIEAEKNPEAAIIIDGLMLVERPKFITDEATSRDEKRAQDRVRNQVKSLKLTAEGQLPRVQAKANKKYNIQVADPDKDAGGNEDE